MLFVTRCVWLSNTQCRAHHCPSMFHKFAMKPRYISFQPKFLYQNTPSHTGVERGTWQVVLTIPSELTPLCRNQGEQDPSIKLQSWGNA